MTEDPAVEDWLGTPGHQEFKNASRVLWELDNDHNRRGEAAHSDIVYCNVDIDTCPR